ncbi:hypothetical protein CD351_06205 [Erythrobacter sp. KY5]|uniref:hypothetical protein n=1 Tax=Erythrobacter sp. KY5 TaxID=2011159 RepID=UPI000DBEF465|nr:hypothetical protein [Erythrobacter sp. KY5]AWW74018.1 hypothetical protein CD351_06205 [Erythrobacter sp. KY5]
MIASLLLAMAQTEPAQAEPDCSYDLQAMLELDQRSFDQDMDGGWRPLGMREGCEIATAELIRAWRHEKRAHDSILYWHEGQLRASGGQTDEAIALFELTYKSPDQDTDFGWNHYVDGTIAFLQDDRERLDTAIERLKQVPEPENNSFTRPDGTVIQMSWPPNLPVLEGFARCWGKTYKQAYGTEECFVRP